jgi:predicted Zn-dependent peptidase
VIDILETPLQPAAIHETVVMKDKPNVDVVIGHASRLRRSNPDFIAARIANNALGQSTLSSRLGLKVRDEMGLTYGINSSFAESGIVDGPFVITVTVAPENVDLAVGATVEIVNDYIANGIREDELKDEQSSIIGSYKIGLATNGGMASHARGGGTVRPRGEISRRIPYSGLDDNEIGRRRGHPQIHSPRSDNHGGRGNFIVGSG